MAGFRDLKEVEELVRKATAHREYRDQADEAVAARQHEEAKRLYTLAAFQLIGKQCWLPRIAGTDTGVRWQPYTDMDGLIQELLMACYIGIAKCCLSLSQVELALDWLEEVRILHLNTRYSLENPLFEWIRWHIDFPELTLQRNIALAMSSDLFKLLGNTGTAVDRRWNTSNDSLPASHHTPELKGLHPANTLFPLLSLRHPDPSLTPETKVMVPALQVLGSWKKLVLKKKNEMKPRLGFTSFIWNGQLYVAGGGVETRGPWLRDLWCLDLEKLDAWRALPSYPVAEKFTGRWMCWHLKVHHDRAYLFTGSPRLDFFDLRTETWSAVITTFNPTHTDKTEGYMVGVWPYPEKRCCESAQEVVGDKLYVFGGRHGLTRLGCSLFMELDLVTMKWRRLSGALMPVKADYSCPGPRKTPSSWVNEDQDRIYLVFGESDREAAQGTGDPNAAMFGYAYEDFWSYGIKEGKWRMERFAGNVPCPRSEAACTYNPKLNKTVVFGGYNPALPTKTERGKFRFSYYADTFLFSPSTSKWQQVLTQGFPTYRAQSQLLSDVTTGKTYLFGGYTNTDAVPSRKDYISRTFADIWELRINVPGGGFEDGGVNVEEEARTARVGPWQRCFACGAVGKWRRCGGSCKGRAFFCDPECLKDGWKIHRQMHGCQKV